MAGQVIAILYRWRLKQGGEDSFREGWRRLTRAFKERGSLGSRLHRATDGTWVAYARWPDLATRDVAMARMPDEEAVRLMEESVEATEPVLVMQIVDDLLVESA